MPDFNELKRCWSVYAQYNRAKKSYEKAFQELSSLKNISPSTMIIPPSNSCTPPPDVSNRNTS